MVTDQDREAVIDAVTATSARVREAVAVAPCDASLAVSLAAIALLLGATVATWPDAGDGAPSVDIVAAWFKIGRQAAASPPPRTTRH